MRTVTARIAERDGPAVAVRAGAKLRSMLGRQRPATVAEALSLVEAHLRDGDRP